MACIQKLRISYEFQNMCKQSSKKLQGYLTELLSVSNKISPEKFVNSELRVTLQPLTKILQKRKKRVSKEQRCSLLKKLLLKTKGRDKNELNNSVTSDQEKCKGGLRNLITFTKSFDFGYKIIKCKNYDHSPLERLSDFSKNFFYMDVLDYRRKILSVLDNVDLSDSEEEELLHILDKENNNELPAMKFEEVIIEPDIKIKTESDIEDENIDFGYDYSSNFVEACYDDDEEGVIKKEPPDTESPGETTFVAHNKLLAEIIPIIPSSSAINLSRPKISVISEASICNKYKTLCSVLNTPTTNSSPPVTELLSAMVARYSDNSKRTLSPNSVRCRTRGNPYINPHLRKQFQFRSFKCNTCNRRFKSPGYLNAHIVKLKHY